LSGGERQRVAIARALINQPRLILADEPTGNLDSKNRGRIMELFASLLEEGITLALVTHDHEVAAYAGRRIRMQDGKIVEDSKA
jgi:ABC-type lipoprotein export system ATPase subunit